MSVGKIKIDQNNGRAYQITIDGQRLPHVRAYSVNSIVDGIPTVLLEFVATAEIAENPHAGHQIENLSTLAEERFHCVTCGVDLDD